MNKVVRYKSGLPRSLIPSSFTMTVLFVIFWVRCILFDPFIRGFSIGDAFVGFHEDTIPSIVMQVCNDLEEEDDASHDDPEDPWEHKVSEQQSQFMMTRRSGTDAAHTQSLDFLASHTKKVKRFLTKTFLTMLHYKSQCHYKSHITCARAGRTCVSAVLKL